MGDSLQMLELLRESDLAFPMALTLRACAASLVPEFISLKMNKPLYCKGLFINYFSSLVVQLFGRAMSLSRSFLHSDCAVS